MKLSAIAPDINYDTLLSVSENERWELGVVRVIFGYRVRFGRRHTCGWTYDYCCGVDKVLLFDVLFAMTQIMESFPESCTDKDIMAVLPRWDIRPINLDGCYDKLMALAKERENVPV